MNRKILSGFQGLTATAGGISMKLHKSEHDHSALLQKWPPEL
jgi:hypothetical protein